MTRFIAGLSERRLLRVALAAKLLVVFLAVSCAGSPGRASPTSSVRPTPGFSIPTTGPSPTSRPTASAQPSPSPTERPATGTMQASAAPVSHTVEPGDTLLGLARAYDVPMAAIQLQNQLGDSTIIQVGQTLSIPPADDWQESSPFWILHQVSPGETLIGIARAYDVEPATLQSINRLDDADRLTAGENLVLPLTGPVAARSPRAAEAPAPTSTPVPSLGAASAGNAEVTEVPEATSPPAAPPAELADWPQEIARLINEVRAQHRLEPLRYDETLARAAQAHADDCARRGWCGHTGSDGATIKTRILRAGYDAAGWAECWAQTQSPRRAVEVWMDETPPNDPHRRTLLTDWLLEIGIGVSDARWGTYIIADFGRP